MNDERFRPYKIFDRRWRIVYGPNPQLRDALREIHRYSILPNLLKHPDFSRLYQERVIHGFVPRRNPLTHARVHKDAGTIVTLDLYHAFEQVTEEQVLSALTNNGLTPQTLEFLGQNAFNKGFIVTGFPTSPDFFNLAFLPTDVTLHNFAKDQGLRYSRYADDLAISTPKEVGFITDEVIDQILAIVRSGGFSPHKITVGHPWNEAVEICGLSIFQGKINIPTRTLHRMRGQIYRWLLSENPPKLTSALSLLAFARKVEGTTPRPLLKLSQIARALKAVKLAF